MHKNANKDYTKEVDLTFTRCPDYINQFPLECYEELVNQQISILTNFSDNYRTNPSVLRATNFLIKQICDGYVSKIPFGKPYSLFRSISVCYLPTFFLMMESDYLCVRSHVYDFFLTLGAHLQIVDTKNAYDCTGALENELVWMLFNILKRQAVIKTQDELIWSAAAKCTLAIVPRPFRHLIDSRALLKFLKIPKLAEKNPSTFTIFSEAFVRSLLTDKRLGVKPHDNLTIDKEAFSSLGNSGLAEIIGLYRNSFTVGARFSYFQFLFSYTAQKVRSTPKESQKDSSTIALPQSLQHCFKELVSLEFFWYLHPLFFYQSHRVTSELANEIIFDLNFKELRENRTVIMAMVQEILLVMAEDSALPKDIMQDFDSSATTGPSLMVVAEDVVGTVPRLLREPDIDVKTYRIAWQLAFLTLRIIKERLGDARGELLADRLISQIVDYDEVTDEQVKYRIRKVCPDLIYSLELLSRTHPSQGTKPLDSILEGFLFLKSAPLTSLLPQLVLVFRFFMEFFSFRNGSILNSPESSNVASLILNGVLLVPSTVLQSIGTRNLWAIYRVLVCDQSQSVCNDRHVIMSLLSSLETSTEMHCVRMWETVMMDLYPPVALIGALRVVQIYKKHSPNPPVEVNERSENLYAQAVNLIYGHGSETGSRQ
ncbi:hypothetical protein AGDE_12218 [Angomonas deanei]|nr:hypothetical protein AGDE_12218 [Angomonas deanei]|eukprot:EPY24695.1 hypothetical protein AGDE_12218 [Angomonas deanei]